MMQGLPSLKNHRSKNRPLHFARMSVSLNDSEKENVVSNPLKWCQGFSGLVLCRFILSDPERLRALYGEFPVPADEGARPWANSRQDYPQ